ncbi:MAG: hypothetical protein ACREFQ_17765 [Stellaceae bacterium]
MTSGLRQITEFFIESNLREGPPSRNACSQAAVERQRSDAHLDANILVALSVPEPLNSMAAAARSLGMAVALP